MSFMAAEKINIYEIFLNSSELNKMLKLAHKMFKVFAFGDNYRPFIG